MEGDTARTADLNWWKERPIPAVPYLYLTSAQSLAGPWVSWQWELHCTLSPFILLLVDFSFLLPSPLCVFSCLIKFSFSQPMSSFTFQFFPWVCSTGWSEQTAMWCLAACWVKPQLTYHILVQIQLRQSYGWFCTERYTVHCCTRSFMFSICCSVLCCY